MAISLLKNKKSGLAANAVPFVAGVAGGIALNDIWEGALTNGTPLPGYGQVLFPIIPASSGKSAVNFGMDDAFQAGISVAVVVVGAVMKNQMIRNVGMGLTLGWAATKFGETLPGVSTTDSTGSYFRNPISLIPHRYPTVTTAGLFDMGTVLPSNVHPSNYPVSAYNLNMA